MLTFDLTSRESFNNLPRWLDEIDRYARDVDIILVGNKYDMESKRAVQKDEAEEFASQYNVSSLVY